MDSSTPHDPAQSPQDVFNTSPKSRDFHAAIESALNAGLREVDIAADYPKDFVSRTVRHFENSGWTVKILNVSPTKKLQFADSDGNSGGSGGAKNIGDVLRGFFSKSR